MGVFRAEIDSVFYGPVDGQNCLLLFQEKKRFYWAYSLHLKIIKCGHNNNDFGFEYWESCLIAFVTFQFSFSLHGIYF